MFRLRLAREHIPDSELRQLSEKYHRRHPTFSLDIAERTCKSVLLICNYHYRHIVIDLRCQCTYNEVLHKFEKQWTTDDPLYKSNLNKILKNLDSTLIYRSLPIQIEILINLLNNYFIQLKPIEEQDDVQLRRKSSNVSKDFEKSARLSIENFPTENTIQYRRRSLVDRSLSWSHSFSRHSSRPHSMFEENEDKK